MARAKGGDAPAIYELHDRWLRDVLPRGSSLLTPGRDIWTLENLAELDRLFVKSPDLTSGKTYLDKLRDQLASASDAARQLMAEIHVIYFLGIHVGAISKTTKLTTIEAILSWMQVPAPIPDDVATAMSPGLYHPGMWSLTRRDTQITWLIEFSRRWKEEGAASILDDPWQLREFASGGVAPSGDAARLALLHQAHPETFEQSLSTWHKKLMVRRFHELTTVDDDVDRQLLEIRRALADEHGEDFDFYSEPLSLMWFRSDSWASFMHWLRRFREVPSFDEDERDYKVRLADQLADVRQQLWNGEPAWTDGLIAVLKNSENNLTGWRINGPFIEWLGTQSAKAQRALDDLWSTDRPPNERLAAFLDGVPISVLPQPGQRLNMATFLLMAGDAPSLPPMKISVFRNAWELAGFVAGPKDEPLERVHARGLAFLDEIVHDSGDWPLGLRDRLDAQGAIWSLVRWDKKKHGVPSSWSNDECTKFATWRSRATSSVTSADEGDPDGEEPESGIDAHDVEHEADEPVDHIAAAAEELCVERTVLDTIVRLLEDKRQVVLYGPPGTGKTYLGLRLARAIAEGHESRVSIVQFHPATTYEDFFEGLRPSLTENGAVTYRRTDGPLLDIANRAAADPGHQYVMMIDELNRANLPKVFGELLFLLEYRQESARTLYRPTEPFKLPENLWFVATMNTADRSIALIDAAMRRRFHFVPFFPHEGAMKDLLRTWLGRKGLPHRVADFLDAVNNDLLHQLGDHLLVGPSHFMTSDLSESALRDIWTYNVFPLIEEHLWGQRDEIARWRWEAVRQRYATQLVGQTAPVEAPPPSTGTERTDRELESAD